MNLRDLSYLVAVSELHSFVKAAEQCFITQPTLSTQIKKLEEDLGVKIFERTNKKVLTTEVGQQIIASAKYILNEVENIKELAAMAQDPMAGNFRLGAFPTLSTYIFPNLVSAINSELPKIRLILVEEKTNKLIQQLKQGDIDAALLSLPVDEDFLQSESLFLDEFKLAVASNNQLAKKKIIKPSDLHQKQLLLLDEGHCLRGQSLQFCQLNGLNEQQDVRATGLEMLRQMVRAGTGITFMPEIAINNPESDICYIPFSEPRPSRNIGLVWRKTCVRHQLINCLIRIVKNTVKIIND